MRTSAGISKCLECGHVDDSRHFSVLVAVESYLHLCPHCRASEQHLLDDLTDYVVRSAMGNLRSIHYTVVNNEFGHYAVADRSSGTRLTTWGSYAHVINEFCATERMARRLSGEDETRGHALETGEYRISERRYIPRAGTDRRLFNLPLPGRRQPSSADVAGRP
jgi:hypothetical protein